ncbi:Lipoprotein NlpI [Rhodocyclaceae bacterium]|nr:Lipoprotein NlpI [Rhodocyclaceae bacterium]
MLSGLLHLQSGKPDEGLRFLRRAAVLAPASLEVLANLGIALRSTGHPDEALTYFDKALLVDGAAPIIHFNRAAALHTLGRYKEAIAAYDQVLAREPDNRETWYQRGLALHAAAREAEALDSYDRALALGDDAEIHYNRGVVLQASGQRPGAISAYERAIALQPDFPAAFNNLGNLLADEGRTREAIAAFEQCLALAPDFVEAHNNLALALAAEGRPDEALVRLDQALSLTPNYVEAHLNRSGVLVSLGRPEAALESIEKAARLAPDNAKVSHNFGIVLHALNRPEEALAHYHRALELQPGYTEAMFHASLSQLLLGDFRAGWQGYGERWNIRGAAPRRHAGAAWPEGALPTDKRILLWCEQGLGDAIQFCRYAPLLTARGARVILEVPRELQVLAGTLAGVETLLVQGEALPDFDWQSPLLDLPRLLETNGENIPSAVPYLAARQKDLIAWRERLAGNDGLKVGIVASGNPRHKNDHNRSLPLQELAALAGPGIVLHLLQKECRPTDVTWLERTPIIRDLRPWLTDLSETAAAVACLDLVITVDTSVAHLAGALGRPVWILLPFNPDWRWLLDRPDSPWYPTARLFRQPAPGDWGSVLATVRQTLSDLIGT